MSHVFKIFSLIVLLFLFSSKSNGLTFNTDDCNNGKGCFFSPDSCTTSENCNFLITFNATNSTTVLFELSGNQEWAAVGFSDNQLMANTDLLICVNGDGSRSGHYYASSRATPQQTTPTPSAVTVIEQAFENGRMKCRVSREINPGLTNFKDLNMDWFLIGGYGPVNGGGGIAQHTTTPLPSTNRLSVVEASQVNVLSFNKDDCKNGKGCFSSPDSCTTSENCDFLITFNATNSNTVLFELSGVGDWVAVGFSDNQLMADTDLLMCVKGDGSRSGHYYASSRATPQQTTPTPSAVTVIEQVFDNGRMKCRVSREINPGLTNFKDINMELFLIGGYGPTSGGGIAQHEDTPLPSTNRLRVPEAGQVIVDSSLATSILVHGILMAIAWTMFAFVGLFTARYMREVWEPTEIFGKKAWFTVHRLLMTTTVSLTISGTIVIFVHVGGWSSGAGAHPICGIIAISLAVIQPIMAAFRPAPDAPKRRIFNWTHRLVGIVALIMAVVTIYLGLDLNQVGLGNPGLYAVIIFSIGVFLVLVFEFYLIMSKWIKLKKTNTRDIPMHPPGYETRQQPKMAPKEAMLRKMMFAFVTLLGFSVTLTIILLLALRD